MSFSNIPIFYILFLMLPIGVGFFGIVQGQLDGFDTGLETSTHWNENATTTLSPQQLCELKGEAWNWTLISECYNKYADCESGKNITECSESDLKRTEMGCGCANDYTFNKKHECVLADQCWNTWQKKDHCESKEKGIWTNLDTCLEEQPSCENQNPKMKEVCDENEKIPGCQCKPNQFHSNYNKTSGISYGPCLDVEGCKQVMIANKIEKAKLIEFPPPVDGIEEDYDAVGWEDYGKMNYNKIIIG